MWKIEICPTCKGNGEYDWPAESWGRYDSMPCEQCDKTGRIITRTYQITLPFDTPDINKNRIDVLMSNIVIDINNKKLPS
jgi:DnaJ-class molecular chaperone